MLQVGYAAQWGKDGRDDLGQMRALGANAVRLYHSFGLEAAHDHGAFLDHAHELGLNVLPGIDGDIVCPEFDCYHASKQAIMDGFKAGFQKGSSWHPAVSMVILLNEPDFLDNRCEPVLAPWCRAKAAVSALEGLLHAEQEAGVQPGRVNLTITWSFAIRTSIDGRVTGAGLFGFQDMVAVTANPALARYTPRGNASQLLEAFAGRWVNGLNTQSPWTYVRDLINASYQQFVPVPWFIGEYGANGLTQEVIKSDLHDIEARAAGNDPFMGAAVFQFQTAYWKGGSEMNFGLFSLGKKLLGKTGEVCKNATCATWPVYCLDTHLDFLPATMDYRAEAVAEAWNGSTSGRGRCANSAKDVEEEAFRAARLFKAAGLVV